MAASQAEKNAYKVMRRGTRACSECRRRKIKCIYDNDESDICQECTAHHRSCTKQGFVRGSDNSQSTRNVKVQVTRLESAVEKLTRENAKLQGRRTSSLSTSLSPLSNDELELEQRKKQSPIFSLFNNEILTQKGGLEAYTAEVTNHISFADPNMTDTEKLLSTIGNVPDVFQVLHFASTWWISWREQHFALRKVAGDMTLHDFVRAKLSDDRPAAVALGLMAVAMALGQIRPGIDDLSFNLPLPANHIMNYILSAVDQIIIDSETYNTQSDAILLYLMRAKHHTENNQLRKAWLRIRQGIRCAQTIGFGNANRAEGSLTSAEAEDQRLIAAIFEIDHLMSMILGFPHAKDPAFTDVRAFSILFDSSITDESLKMRALRRVVAVCAGHVNERNAGVSTSDDFMDATQATLEMAANMMPSGWWTIIGQTLDFAVHRYESMMTQMWYWTVQAYLNMPYLINPSSEGSGPRYRELCMEGTRNLLRSFNYLRAEPSISVYMCNCDDFQALIGACILLVGILQDISSAPTSPPSPTEFCTIGRDLALIEELKDIFRYRKHEQGGAISKQGLAVLEELLSFVYDEEEYEPSEEAHADLSGMNININKAQRTIMLPYFGTITLQLTKRLSKQQCNNMAHQTLLTPPRSIDGCVSNGGASEEPLFHDGFNSNITDEPPSYLETVPSSKTSPIDFTMHYKGGLQSVSHEQSADGLAFGLGQDSYNNQPIDWNLWENFMFGQELSQEWNPGLMWDQNGYTG